jgi:asparagine synthase (glutamine-hydrolysing)
MAGICGFLTFRGRLPAGESFQRAMAAIERRGVSAQLFPIGDAIALAASGSQCSTPAPSTAVHGRAQAVLDGFLTNYQALRHELASRGPELASDSHAEAVLGLYEHYGESIAERLEGSYAAAIWDPQSASLLLIRDRFGARPLFWFSSPEGLAFSSSLPALCALGAPAEIDLQAVDDYLSLGYVPAPGSIYRSIQKLPAAHALRATCGGEVDVRRYWDVAQCGSNPPSPPPGNHRDWQEMIWTTLKGSVQKFAPGGERLGAFLSGGPDSAALVAALDETGRAQLPAFTIGFRDREFDESPSALLTAQRYRTPHSVLALDDRDGLKLPECVSAFDEPYAHPSSVPIYLLSEMAGRVVDVTLGGDGADLLFGGASTYRASDLLAAYQKLPRFVRSGLLPWVIEQLPVRHARASFRYLARRFVSASEMSHDQAHLAWMEVLSDDLKTRLYGPRLAEGPGRESPLRLYRDMFERCQHFDRLNRLMYADLNLFLAEDILTKVDRLSAVHGLEVRTPYLDRELTEFCFRLPPEVKVHGSQRKYLFRQALRGKIPEETLQQKKMGFISPASQWLCGAMREMLRDTLSPAALRDAGFLQPGAVTRLIEEHLSLVQDHGRVLWSLLAFSLWLSRNHEANRKASA